MSEQVKAPRPLTPKMIAILSYLAAHEGAHFASDIAGGLEDVTEKQVNPVCTTLVGRGFIAKGEKGTKTVVNKKGLEEVRSYNTYFITDDGRKALADAE